MRARCNLRVVRDHDDRLTGLIHLGKEPQNVRSDRRIKITGWFIGKQ